MAIRGITACLKKYSDLQLQHGKVHSAEFAHFTTEGHSLKVHQAMKNLNTALLGIATSRNAEQCLTGTMETE